jgi:hypothetical protein
MWRGSKKRYPRIRYAIWQSQSNLIELPANRVGNHFWKNCKYVANKGAKMQKIGQAFVIMLGALLITSCAQAVFLPTATARIIVVTATLPPSTPTPQATQTPLPAATEPVALGCQSTSPNNGWECFQGAGFELWLPESYVGGGDPSDLLAVTDILRNAGQEALASSLEANIGQILFYAIDTTISNPTNFYSSVNVIKEQNPILESWTIEDYMDASLSQLANMEGIQILESGEFTIAEYEAYRLISEYDMNVFFGAPGFYRTVQYLVKNGDRAWVLTYATANEEYDSRLTDFDTSAKSFVERGF